MPSIFGRHRIRANFYHFVSFLYVLTMVLWGVGVIGSMTSTWIGFFLFAVDYLAQLYDPHPDNPGPWFKRHFHRMFEDDEPEVPYTVDWSPYYGIAVAASYKVLFKLALSLAVFIVLVTVL